jgi:hypothetical protein
LGQGVCDAGQPCRVRHLGKAVALLPVFDAGALGLATDELVAVEDDLGGKGRVPGHLDRDVSPLGIPNVERVMVHERLLLGQVADRTARGMGDVPHRCRCPGHQNQEHPRLHRMIGQEVLGDAMLAFN